MSATEGEIGVTASSGGRPLTRATTTASSTDIPVTWYRTDGTPPIFAGFQVNWIDGNDPDSGAEFDLCAGAGFGSKFMTLTVRREGHPTVYEYVDITEVLQQRIAAILDEATA